MKFTHYSAQRKIKSVAINPYPKNNDFASNFEKSVQVFSLFHAFTLNSKDDYEIVTMF